jgi:hypothetical protein
MNRFWASVLSPRARFLRLGTMILLLAFVGWMTIAMVYEHQLPPHDLKRVSEFMAAAVVVFYGIDKAAGRLGRPGRGRTR